MSDSIRMLEELSGDIRARLDTLTYEELGALMGSRQKIVDQIEQDSFSVPLSGEDKARIKAVIEHDESILNRINFLRNEAADWLQSRNQAKAQRSAYETSYVPDAYLMDSRK